MARLVRPAEYMARTRAIGTATGLLLAQQWDRPGLWVDKLTTAAAMLAVGQTRAAGLADGYVSAAVGGSDSRIVAEAFGGVASDGRPLPSLLAGASVAANAVEVDRAREVAKSWLLMVAMTQVADAARASLRSAMAVRDAAGVRVASQPCCGRCAVLNGRVYSWRADFQRHPRCDCTYQPARRGETPDVPEVPLDQIRGLSQADRQAVEMGADLSRVVNAQRGMYSTRIYGQDVKATFDSTARRRSAFPVRDHPNTVRLRPESILAHAKDPEDAARLLARFGYIR